MAVMGDMIWEGILPGISKQILLEKGSRDMLDGLKIQGVEKWSSHIVMLAKAKLDLMQKTRELAELKESLAKKDTRSHAEGIVDKAVPLMEDIRKIADSVEIYLSAEYKPYPNYRNLLSLGIMGRKTPTQKSARQTTGAFLCL